MSRLDAAFRRSLTQGGNQPMVIDLSPDVAYDRTADRQSIPEPERRPPPADAANHLASLVQTLDLHPAKPRTVAFVACGRSEGTTTCLANVGRYLAQHCAKVLMVDANVQWPALHTIAKVNRDPGLLDVMACDMDVVTAIQPTSVPTLFVLSSGDPQRAASRQLLLPSVLRERLFNRTAEYDFVLIDCPAVNACEDAAVTAAACDAAIMVVEGGRTLREEAQASKARLTQAHARILGVFINKRKFYVPQFLYDRL
jgi:capsular exopolysaccharide synthesis family protein